MIVIAHPQAPEDMRARAFAFEREQAQKPQVELKVIHHFSLGVCARELHIPAGTDVTGRVHKFPNLNILSQGEMLVTTEHGLEHIKAPFHIVSPPGTKRAARTLTDCVWTTILGTHETDPEKIEAHFTTNDEAEYLAFVGNHILEG